MRRLKAFSLVELLLVIAIIALLAGLLFPVLASSKKAGQRGASIAELKQIGIAMLMYREDFNAYPERVGLDVLVETGYITSPRILLAPGDSFAGFAGKELVCERKVSVKHPQSYSSVFEPKNHPWKEIERVDSNPGLLATRIYGNKVSKSNPKESICDSLKWMFEGTLLRFRQDGSVQTAKFSLAPDRNIQGAVKTYKWYRMFTDEKTKWDQ